MFPNGLGKHMRTNGLPQKEFDRLFELYYQALTGFVYSFVNDSEVARDLVHDLFLNVWKKRAQLDPQKSVKTYLFTMARNQALNYLKHQQVIALNERGLIEEYGYGQEEPEDLERRLEQVRKKLAELPSKQHDVVIKCCVEGKMYRQAAAELGISENTVKTHLMRAMKFLREELREDFILLLLIRKWHRETEVLC